MWLSETGNSVRFGFQHHQEALQHSGKTHPGEKQAEHFVT